MIRVSCATDNASPRQKFPLGNRFRNAKNETHRAGIPDPMRFVKAYRLAILPETVGLPVFLNGRLGR
jgi:hypothetical protein